MADAATEFLLNNLKEIVLQHAHLIGETKGNIENLQRDLVVFKAFLRDTVNKRKEKESDQIKVMVKEIHDIVYEVEDIIDVFVTKTIDKKHKNRFFRFFRNQVSLHEIGTEVEKIKEKVKKFREEINLPTIEEDKYYKPETRPPRKKDVVGFEEVTDDLTQRLLSETDYLDVISLIGMFGLGKTTLAWKIFDDQKISFKFRTRIWLPVSQQFNDKEIFLRILNELTTLDDEIRAKEAPQLADIIADYLQEGSFLIVMDDVWSDTDWERLKVALPSNNPRGKVLITSRHKEVGEVASKPRPLYSLRFFRPDESWELFRLEALGKLDCPPELEEVGRLIAENCDGLPLAIVVIGGILAKTLDRNINATKKEWKKVSEHVSSYLNEGDHSKRMQKFISLSYDNLPYHLRACFLYLGLFPEDHEISVSKLIRMWIGEGFIQQKVEYNSLEEIGEKYLKDLISRNLVKSVKFRPDGKVKTCQIHDTLGDFCRNEAATENFLQEIKHTSDGQFLPPISTIGTCRRLSIHSNCLPFINAKPFGPRVRSFVCFSDNKYVVTAENSSKIIGAFTLLRVLDVQPFKFDTIDSDLYKLIHMRYMALSFKLSILPAPFNQLSHIQTLIIETTSPILDVKADIWKMKHLRHFKTNASAILPKPTKSDKLDVAQELQTLGLISVESCTEELTQKAPNLKKLGIRGRLALLFGKNIASFDRLRNAGQLGKLKLVNDEPQEGGILKSVPFDRFPSGLTSLTLCSTFLSWEDISTLGSLKLEVLKLKDRAFLGRIWEVEEGGFHSLQFLHIEQTDLVFWKASAHHFPKLRSLVLKDCVQLRGIPTQLAGIRSFQMLELSTCVSAVKSAKEISNEKKLAKGSEFTLSIYPPTD